MADENLYPDGYEDEILGEEDLDEEEPIGYRPGVAFDWDSGDFIRDGKHRLMEASGVESWQQWCMNCLQTARYKHIAYSDDFGIDTDEIFSSTNRGEAESVLTREINDALMADPYGRTEYIPYIDFDWFGPDSVKVTVTAVGIDDVTIDVTANITNG